MDNIFRSDGVLMDTRSNEKDVIRLILDRPLVEQHQTAKIRFQELLRAASRPRHESGNACIKLCYFIELSRTAAASPLRDFAFSSSTCLDLFSFYVEWNEKNQHRSMRQVIELLATLLIVNPDQAVAQMTRAEILQRLLSIICHRSAQPLVKPAFKALECLLSKCAFSPAELLQSYCMVAQVVRDGKLPAGEHMDDSSARDRFVSDVFDWMSLPDTAPAAGKLLVTFFQILRIPSAATVTAPPEAYTILWQRWIRQGLVKYPDSLENIKNYLFPPLFKLDRSGSLQFLQELSQSVVVDTVGNQEMNDQALLLLSAMEVGKKLGLVDELNASSPRNGLPRTREFVALPEEMIGILLTHCSSTVRSSAFSVLVSSVSSIRPFPLDTLSVLRENIAILHADTDARFRNEVLSNSKHMVERLRGAMAYLTREIEIPTISKKAGIHDHAYNQALLSSHTEFLQWYLQFLSAELVPTASYQRHITSLRAFQQLAKSGIIAKTSDENTNGTALSRPVWPFTVDLFIPSVIHLLLDLLMDPFEDVRASACSLLKLSPAASFDDNRTSTVADGGSLKDQAAVQAVNRDMHDDNIALFSRLYTERGLETPDTAGELRMLLNFIRVVEAASNRTGRADLADGVARSYELLSTLLPNDHARYCLIDALTIGLEHKTSQAKTNLARAVNTSPIHGQFASLRLVWETILKDSPNSKVVSAPDLTINAFEWRSLAWNELQSRIVRCCEKIWAHVEHVLCNDSPEGHVLDDLEDLESLDTKDVLSYSFRAIHESSNLLQVMVCKLLPKAAGGSHFLPYELFQKTGGLTFIQLSDLRHRGAFSTVSVTFSRCCQLIQDYTEEYEQANSLLQEWYQAAVSCIFKQVSTTRRSAGIPALITGILSAHSKSPGFDEVLAELKSVAQMPSALSEKDETALPQVHAMNCLKEIFKSSVLGKRCESHIAECLEIAADSLSSEIWAIRNCGLLFLRSLIDCLFGTSESKTATEAGWDGRSIKLSYDRYPALPELLIRLLSVEAKQQASPESVAIGTVESVFPALDIIRRAGPPSRRREELFSLVATHLGSKVWHMRDLAARTVCTLLLHDDWLSEIHQLLADSELDGSTNLQHGVFLSIKYFLERRLELNPETASDDLSTLLSKIPSPQNGCPILTAAYRDIVTIYLKIQNFEGTLDHDSTLKHGLESKEIFVLGSTSSEPHAVNALIRKSSALNSVLAYDRDGGLNRLRDILILAAQHDIDTALFVLDNIPLQWRILESSPKTLVALRDLYLEVLGATKSGEIRGVALRDLAVILEQLSVLNVSEEESSLNLSDALVHLAMSNGGPELSNAGLRITGSLLLREYISSSAHDPMEEALGSRIEAWGEMLASSIHPENEFDRRLAAVMALGAFYRAIDAKLFNHPAKSYFVSSTLALYDTLNDDDDDIRDVGASIISQMMGGCYVPMAAGSKILPWCLHTFGDTDSFRTAVLNRLTGTKSTNGELYPATEQLKLAVKSNDSLFAEEEHNLYIDEVREILLWNSLVIKQIDPIWDHTFKALATWTFEGLSELQKTAGSQNYGWTSKPEVFTIFMRIVVAAKTVLSWRVSKNNRDMVENASTRLVDNTAQSLRARLSSLLSLCTELHVHPLLLEELRQR